MGNMNYDTGECLTGEYDYYDDVRTGTVSTYCCVCENDFDENTKGVVEYWDEHGAVIEWEDSKILSCPTCGQWWDELQREDYQED